MSGGAERLRNILKAGVATIDLAEATKEGIVEGLFAPVTSADVGKPASVMGLELLSRAFDKVHAKAAPAMSTLQRSLKAASSEDVP